VTAGFSLFVIGEFLYEVCDGFLKFGDLLFLGHFGFLSGELGLPVGEKAVEFPAETGRAFCVGKSSAPECFWFSVDRITHFRVPRPHLRAG